jgi:hypothetical protein
MKPDGFNRIGRTVTPETADRGCLKKRHYASRNEARDAATKLQKKPGNYADLRPYRCGLCSGWHLTSSMPFSLSKRPKEARAR